MTAGAVDFLTKPVNSVDLVAKIKVMLRIKMAEDQLRNINQKLAKVVQEKSRDLVQTREKYRQLVESNKDAIVAVDMDGLFVDFNQAFIDMIGYSGRELHKLSFNDITPGKWGIKDREMWNQIMERGYCDEYEKEYTRKDRCRYTCQSERLGYSRG